MRLILLLAVLALVPALAHAQGNETNATSTTPTPSSPAAAGTPPPIEIALQGHTEGALSFWTIEGSVERNPVITVEPGQQVTFHVRSVSGSHNLKIGAGAVSKVFSEDEPAFDVVWTAPATPGAVTYICTIHGKSMSGTIQVGAAAAPGGSGNSSDLAGGGISGATVDVPGCPGAKVPAAVAQGVAGGPTMADYVQKCQAGSTVGVQSSGADLVIPVSFGLIALGIVAVVWVHKSYKP